MGLEFKKNILKLLKNFSQGQERKFLLVLNKKLDIPFPGIQGTDVESKIKVVLKQITFYKKNELFYLQISGVEVSLNDLYTSIEKYNQTLKAGNAESFISKIPNEKDKRNKSLNDIFPDWLKVAKTYYKLLTIIRGGKYYTQSWAKLDFDYFQVTSLMFLKFARGAYIKKPVRIICPEGTINLNENIPRFSNVVKDFYSSFENLAKDHNLSYVSIDSDETIGKKYFEYAYHIFTGARLCSNTGRFKNFYSRIGVAKTNKRGKTREIKKEIRAEDTLTLIRKIFANNLFDGRFYNIKNTKELIAWTPRVKQREDFYTYFHSIVWDKRHNRRSAVGIFLINITKFKFSVRHEFSHFVLITSNDPYIN